MTNTETIQSLIDSGEGYNVEFKVRVPSKVRELTEEICAFANADGGYLLIGINDNGQIIGTDLENDKRSAIQGSISEISPALHCDMYAVNIEDKTVWVIDVPSGKDKPYIFSGSIFMREGANSQKLRTVEEMRSFFQECNKIFFDAIPCSWFNIYTDADEQAIKDFRTEAKLSPSTANKQIFENLELFTDNGVAKNGAAMFFGKQPERKFPHAVTRCVLFKGTTKVYIIDDKTFSGPLYQQYLQAMAWLESKLQVAYKIEGAGPREEIWEIPLTVFVFKGDDKSITYGEGIYDNYFKEHDINQPYKGGFISRFKFKNENVIVIHNELFLAEELSAFNLINEKCADYLQKENDNFNRIIDEYTNTNQQKM